MADRILGTVLNYSIPGTVSDQIPIKLAEAALEAEASQHKAELACWKDAATGLAELADKAFYYSREDRARADILIKTIRTMTNPTSQTK